MKSFSGLDTIAVVFKMVDLDRVWVAHPQWDQTWVKSQPPSPHPGVLWFAFPIHICL